MTSNKSMANSYKKASNDLVASLPPRTKNILVERFGLQTGKPKTLDSIGRRNGITRERVRQIVEDGLYALRSQIEQEQKNHAIKQIFRQLSQTLQGAGSIKREDLLLASLAAKNEAAHVIFLLHLGDQFENQRETVDFYPFWTNKKEIMAHASELHSSVKAYLLGKKQMVSFEDLKKMYVAKRIGRSGFYVPLSTFSSFLETSKHIMQGYDRKWGLKEWLEVNPKGIKDKSYVVLKNTKKPLHFREVAALIAELQEALGITIKRVLPQTVHNELIKDKRFVLVGRGMYALHEWGYSTGTVKDVLQTLLRTHKALAKQELLNLVKKERQVKDSTILLNLQDKNIFAKDGQGRYYIP